jgi:hypothetical protein
MTWTHLPTGRFTGIDWAKPRATAGMDPYLVWAEADQFAGYGDDHPRWLPIALELHANCSIAQLTAAASARWLTVPAVYTSGCAPAGLRFCTARVRPKFFAEIAKGGRLHPIVKRLELGLPAAPYNDQPGTSVKDELPQTSSAINAKVRSAAERLQSGKVLGLIDDSFALAHANFLGQGGKPRIAFFWRQDSEGKGRVPKDMAYGRELTDADIGAAIRCHSYNGIVDESAVYTALGLSVLGQKWPHGHVPFHALDTAVSHGTHVMDLAGGPRTLLAQVSNLPPGFDAPPSWAPADDAASRCPIVAVQLDYDTVADTSGGSLNVHVLDGLMYILSRCTADAEIVVNLSFGTLAGPHNGTSLVEAAMDQLVSLCGNRLKIALAAGNSYQARTHANVTLGKNQDATLRWCVLPDDSSQSFLELWMPETPEGVEIQVTPPGREPLPALRLGESRMWLDGGKRPVCALIYPARVATGENATCALLALAPTFSLEQKVATAPTSSLDHKVATAPSGVWQVRLNNTKSGNVTIDAYVERDDVVIGTRGGAKQSHFEDEPQWPSSQQYDMQAFVDQPSRKTPIRRSGNFNSIATGSGTVSVGGIRINNLSWAHYSPRKPDPDAARPSRAGVVKVPDAAACSDENPALTGVRAAGTRSSAVVKLRGTSSAAPQVSRKMLNEM